jgi:small subunit ribosomal protein S1
MGIGAQVKLPEFSMKDLLARSEFDLPKVGQVLTGEIISIGKSSILIDLDALGTGIVYPGEFYDNPNLQDTLKPGQQASVVLLDLENEEGYREISLKQAQMTTAWQDIRNKKESGEIIDTKVVNINKGGLIVEINNVQGFLPLSQLLPEHYPKVEGGDTTKIVQALQKFRNQDIKVKIIDFSEHENKLIVSERAISDAEIKEELAKLKVGDVVEAVISEVTDFGAFATIAIAADSSQQSALSEEAPVQEIRLEQPELVPTETTEVQERSKGKIEGLIHISEIDWKLIDNPRDFLQTGQRVKAKIISIDGSRVSLSLKALKPDPWEKIEEKYNVGQTISGEVVKITNFGVSVRLDEEISGFIPAPELGEAKPADSIKLGDKLDAAIVSIDPKEHKMVLTLQKAREQEQESAE